jgi:putative hydrolase
MTKKGLEYLRKVQDKFRKGIPNIDFHIHTSWTDGQHSVQAMYEQACHLGLECILFSEHARKNSSAWFPKFVADVRSLPEKPCMALVGVETRVIDFSGNINLDKEMISLCDLVVGSVHRFPDKSGGMQPFETLSAEEAMEIEFKLACLLLENPKVDILGHPLGMSITKYGVIPPLIRYQCLFEKSLKNDKAFEINSRYHSNPRTVLQWCRNSEVKISLGSDAHCKNELGRILLKLSENEADT